MIHDRVHRGWYCVKCGGAHPISLCPAAHPISKLPLETPSGNGAYRGTAPVREIPFGVMGTVDEATEHAKYYREKAGIASRRSALVNKFKCHQCGKVVAQNTRLHKYCSLECRREKERIRERARRIKRKRQSKWER